MFKTCTKCGNLKTFPNDFPKAGGRRNGYRPECLVCHRDWHKEYQRQRRNQPDGQSWVRDNHYNFKYGIRLADYNFLLALQNGVCALCGLTENENHRRLAVDHDHSCCPPKQACKACIRGLLCTHCNRYVVPWLEKDISRQTELSQKYLASRPLYS